MFNTYCSSGNTILLQIQDLADEGVVKPPNPISGFLSDGSDI